MANAVRHGNSGNVATKANIPARATSRDIPVRRRLNCPISTGAHIATVCQLGNIAYRCKEKITWDKAKQQLTNEKLNQEYLFAKYHNGYKLPKV